MKKVLFLLVMSCVLILTSCSGKLEARNNDVSENSTTEKDTGYYDALSAEQVEYLNTYCFMDEDEIDTCTYDELAGIFLGTGMELYNKTSGILRNGVTYYLYETNPEVAPENYGKYYFNIVKDGDSAMITIEEAYEIRDKELDIRVDDYLNYEYYMEGYETSEGYTKYEMYLPIADYYKNVYVAIYFREYEDGKVTMDVPRLKYINESDEEHNGETYYFYLDDYRRDYKFSYIDEDGFMILPSEYVFGGVSWNSVTDSSLIIDFCKYTDDYYYLNESFKIYKVDGEKEILVGEYDTDDSDDDYGLNLLSSENPEDSFIKKIWNKITSIFSDKKEEYNANGDGITGVVLGLNVDLTLATGGEELEPGTYLIKFGINKENYLYIEDEFVVK
mgnify:CR=1 FL=1